MKSFRYIALAALTISFAACTQEDDFTPQGDSDAVKINATIGAMQTRVAYGVTGATTFTNGDAFKVVNTMRNTKNEATYTTTDGTNWTTADAFVWNGGTAKNQFQAWYPATAFSSYDSFTLPTNQSRGIEAADWMTASTNEILKPADGVLTLAFQHRLAKVTVEIADWNSEFDNQTHEITDPIIYSKGTDLTANYNDDGSVTITSTGNDREITPLVSEDNTSYTAIVAPVKYNTSDNFMTFTVNGQAMTVLAKATALTEGLQAGKHYSFKLTVGKEAVSIASVDVTPWNEMDIDAGVAEEKTTE